MTANFSAAEVTMDAIWMLVEYNEVEEVRTALSADRVNIPVGDRRSTLLHSAKSAKMATLLLDKGANVDARTEYKTTPLQHMVWDGRGEAAQVLLERGADPSTADGSGVTPLHQAYYRSYLGIIALLLKHGADENARLDDGRIPKELYGKRR